MENSHIEWTDHTFNAWTGCRAVSPACDNCYAEGWAKRAGRDFSERRLTSDANWKLPMKWDRQAAKEGRRYRVFTNSLADVFDAEVPDEWRDRLFALMALTPNLDWLVLTKRPKVARDYLTNLYAAAKQEGMSARAYLLAFHDDSNAYEGGAWGGHEGPLPNVHLGTTVENQAMADLRLPLLLSTPAAGYFVSCEPLLGPVDLTRVAYTGGGGTHLDVLHGVHGIPGVWSGPGKRLGWVIVGGNSGPKARPMHPDWARTLRDQCAAAGVPFLFKQWGQWAPGENCGPARRMNTAATWDYGRWFSMTYSAQAVEEMHRDDQPDVWLVGKKAAGRHLDGVLHDAGPAWESRAAQAAQ